MMKVIEMKSVARFTTRLQGEGDGLFIGVTMDPTVFKPNTVYEIRDILRTLTICEVGMAGGAGRDNCVSNMMSEGKTLFHWGQDMEKLCS
jgi:hypothetical protein